RRALVRAHVGPFVRRERTALGAVDPTRRDLLAVDEECAGAALADATTVIGELEADRCLPSGQRLLGGHRVALEAQPVVGVRWLAVFHVEAPAAEATCLSQDHAVGPVLP